MFNLILEDRIQMSSPLFPAVTNFPPDTPDQWQRHNDARNANAGVFTVPWPGGLGVLNIHTMAQNWLKTLAKSGGISNPQ